MSEPSRDDLARIIDPGVWVDGMPTSFRNDSLIKADAILALRAAKPERERVIEVENHDDLEGLVARFSAALLSKLQDSANKGRRGWDEADWKADCQRGLARHVAKGDPLDVGAYAAFCWHHGWPTIGPVTPKEYDAIRALKGDPA